MQNYDSPKREICLIIKGIDYQTGEVNIILQESNNVYHLPRIPNLEEKTALDYCSVLLYNLTHVHSDRWIKFSQKEYRESNYDGKLFSLIYSCNIPFDVKIIDEHFKWVSVRTFFDELHNKTKESFNKELNSGILL